MLVESILVSVVDSAPQIASVWTPLTVIVRITYQHTDIITHTVFQKFQFAKNQLNSFTQIFDKKCEMTSEGLHFVAHSADTSCRQPMMHSPFVNQIEKLWVSLDEHVDVLAVFSYWDFWFLNSGGHLQYITSLEMHKLNLSGLWIWHLKKKDANWGAEGIWEKNSQCSWLPAGNSSMEPPNWLSLDGLSLRPAPSLLLTLEVYFSEPGTTLRNLIQYETALLVFVLQWVPQK